MEGKIEDFDIHDTNKCSEQTSKIASVLTHLGFDLIQCKSAPVS